ncbi:hypothetical protein NDU88_004709 [Pleurodeles waltl]|uniref:Uncharacterized protein n=1 Tax=Pleurodeles waltl TaxID=8319 RepID=A0AAV7UIX5_PLEWA|nr:hypothetical protein NDU88_004709 [Pleurodeles waltl]
MVPPSSTSDFILLDLAPSFPAMYIMLYNIISSPVHRLSRPLPSILAHDLRLVYNRLLARRVERTISSSRVFQQQGAPSQPLWSHLASLPDDTQSIKRAPGHPAQQSSQHLPPPSATASTSSSAVSPPYACQGRAQPKTSAAAQGLPSRLQSATTGSALTHWDQATSSFSPVPGCHGCPSRAQEATHMTTVTRPAKSSNGTSLLEVLLSAAPPIFSVLAACHQQAPALIRSLPGLPSRLTLLAEAACRRLTGPQAQPRRRPLAPPGLGGREGHRGCEGRGSF